MTRSIFSVWCLVLGAFWLSQTAHAQSPTTTIRDSVQKQVEAELSQIKQGVAKRAFVGSISAKSDGQITITNLKNQSRKANVTADAAIKLAGNKDGTPADLKVGDFVISMGDVDSQNLMTVKRLLVIAKPEDEKRGVYYGRVTKVTTGSLTLETQDKKSVTIQLQASTKYTPTTKASDIKVDSKVVVVTGSGTSLPARKLHLFP